MTSTESPIADQRLIFFKVNRLGDNLVSLPAVQALKAVLPEAALRIYTDPIARDLYTGMDVEIVEVPLSEYRNLYRHPLRLAREIMSLRRFQPTAAVLPADQSSIANLFTRIAGFQHVVGAKQFPRKISPRLTRTLDFDVDTPMAHLDWQLALALLEELGVHHNLPSTPPPPDLSHLVGQTKRRENHIVIHAGGSIPVKRWFPERFEELANSLSKDFEVTWIHHGDPQPQNLSPTIPIERPGSIAALTRLLASASLFIGNNSGPMNIAAAIGTPLVILCGPSTARWDPVWHQEQNLLLRHPNLPCLPCDRPGFPAKTCANTSHPMACMDYWTVEQVEEICRQQLKQGSPLIS